MVVQKEKPASIGQLAAGLAQEIKNPLAIILQGTEFIKSCIEDEFRADCAERVKNLANRADNIMQGRLSYSRQGGAIESVNSGRLITIELRKAPEGKSEILIEISDKGYGIEKKNR